MTYSIKRKSYLTLSDNGSKILRKEEELLWHFSLKGRKMAGYQFLRHYQVGDTTVDFICKRLNLIIQIINGATYQKIVADVKRDADIKNMGYRVLTFSESQVINQLDKVIEYIKDVVETIGNSKIKT